MSPPKLLSELIAQNESGDRELMHLDALRAVDFACQRGYGPE